MSIIAKNNDVKLFESWSIPLGVLGQNFLFGMVSTYLMFYYTDVVLLAPLSIGILFGIARVWDAVNDPLMGFLADRTRTRWGKFRPFILAGTIPMIVLGVLCFSVPEISSTGKLIYAYITYILFGMAYTVMDIPLWASPAVVTTDNNKRTAIISRNQLFALIGYLIVGFTAIKIVEYFGENRATGFRNAALIYGILALILLVPVPLIIKERVLSRSKKNNFKECMKLIFQNKPLILVLLTQLMTMALFTLKSSIVTYYVTYNIGNISLVPVMMLAMAIPMILGMMAASPAAAWLGKRRAVVVSTVLAALFGLVWFFTGYGNFTLLCVLSGVSGFFTALPVVITTAMVADTIEYAEWKHGIRGEGVIFSLRTLTGKLATALAGLGGGVLLALVGYVANAEQSAEALSGLHMVMSLFPAAASLVGLIPLIFYPLTQEKYREIVEELAVRNRAEQN